MEKTQQPKANAKAQSGTIRAVHSGDAITIAFGGVTEKCYLSNVQAPYIGSPNRAEEAFAHAARESIRNKIIGRKCQFTIDYEHNSRQFVTLMVEKECINVLVIESGFARVVERGG